MKRFNKKKKLYTILFIIVACIGIGYAYLNASLNINGTAKISNNTWDIHFVNLVVDSNSVPLSTGDSAAVINPSNNTEVTYTVTLQKPGDFYEFTVDAKNFGTIDGMIESVSSKLGGVDISSTNPLPNYLNYSVTYEDDIPIDIGHILGAGSKETYKVRLEYKRDIEISDLPSSVQNLSLSFSVTYIQADETAILKPEWPVIMAFSGTYDYTAFRDTTYKNNIKSITLGDSINPPANYVASWDVGVAQNGNVMAYVTVNAVDNTKYDLYIQGDGHLYANPDSSFLFCGFEGVDSLNNIDVLDTSKVTNMYYMFFKLGYSSTVFTLDLGNNFDTSKVTNMNSMFAETGRFSTSFNLNLGNKFDTSHVTNMNSMFTYTGYSSTVFTLNLGSKFDTHNVVNMGYIFHNAGYSNPNFTLNLGSKFDTSKVTNMKYMFSYTGYNSTVFTLDLGSKFDTSSATDMQYMFDSVGCSSPVFTLNLGSKFNTSNVETMKFMLRYVGFSNPNFTIDLGSKFNTSNVTNMSQMFAAMGHANPAFELDLSTFDFSNVTEFNGMFGKGGEGWDENYPFPATNKIYVKNSSDVEWIVTNVGADAYRQNAFLTRSNVLVKS